MGSLRDAAEIRLAALPRAKPILPAEELLHELRVSQVELEMQNEALRQAQQALDASRDRYADLYEFAPVGYLTLSRSACINAINLTGAGLLGSERRKLLDRRFARFVIPEERDRWNRYFINVASASERQACELNLLRDDGSRFHARLDGCLHPGPEGGAPELRLTLTDLTHGRDAEQARQARNVLFDSPHQFNCLLSPEGNLMEANATTLDFGGLAADRVLGMPLWLTPWWAAAAHSRQALQEAIRQAARGMPASFSAEWTGGAGQTAFVECSLRPVRDAAGDVAQLLLEAKNVSRWKLAEAALLEKTALLDGYVRAAPVGMVMLDRDLRYLHLNETLAAMNGRSVEDHLGRTLEEVIPELSAEVSALYRDVLERK